jgi:hypothetical protein
MSRTVAVAITLAAAFFACRSSGDDAPGDDVEGDAASGDVTIQEIQNDAMAPGTAVTLKGVVVTVIDQFGDKTGDFWVQEPGGGERSGVHVFGAPLAMVGALAVGDLVDIAGAQKDEFAYAGSNGVGGDTSGRSITELKPVNGGMMTVTKTGTGTVPAPMVVDALAIGQKATQIERDAEWEKWEGVLITVMNVAALSDADCVGSACNDKSLNKFDITGGAVVESALAPLPGGSVTTPGNVNRGDCLGSVTGVVDYFFDYLLLNTAADSIMTGGTGCPVAEAAATCADSIDNDGNGFTDCKDNGCIPTLAACRAVTTISALQTTTPTTGIELQGVIVTALSKVVTSAGNKRFNMWVQTNAGIPGANESVYVFGPGIDLTPFAVGTKVDIIGTVEEFNDSTGTETLTEIKALTITAATGTAVTAPVTGKTAAELSAAATGEPYEGAMVTLTNVKVTALGNFANFGVGSMSSGGTSFKTDDDIFLLASPVNTCFLTITGVWTYMPYDNVYGFLPLAAGTGTGVCP